MSGIYGARLAQKSSRISREESARAMGDVDERASKTPPFKEEETRRRKNEREREERRKERQDSERERVERERVREGEASRV